MFTSNQRNVCTGRSLNDGSGIVLNRFRKINQSSSEKARCLEGSDGCLLSPLRKVVALIEERSLLRLR